AHRIEAFDEVAGWRTLAAGTTIGHQRLHRWEPLRTRHLRIILVRFLAPPALASVGIYGGRESAE
ncbi:MAG TPA: hypothetical protein VIS74_02795, partial [Chthoniobacterales bacterium]